MIRVLFMVALATMGLLVGVIWIARVWAKTKRENRYVEMWKQSQYVIPDGKNEYLRSRLQSALAVSEGESVPVDAKFLYARKMLCALSEKKLSGADSLIVRKLEKDVGRYAMKDYFSMNERGDIAGVLSKLLALCAKYEV